MCTACAIKSSSWMRGSRAEFRGGSGWFALLVDKVKNFRDGNRYPGKLQLSDGCFAEGEELCRIEERAILVFIPSEVSCPCWVDRVLVFYDGSRGWVKVWFLHVVPKRLAGAMF